MKRILLLFAGLAFVASASAQVLISYDFEDGTYDEWKVWLDKTNEIVEGDAPNGGEYALKVGIGTFCNVHGVKAKSKYLVSFDYRNIWGKTPAFVVVHGYDPKEKGLVEIVRYELPMDKEQHRIKLEFKSRFAGYHRVTFAPNGQTGGRFIIDNVLVEYLK